MKQIAFVSGKGGTGKSTLVSSLSLLVTDKMLADCDVDAPNLHLLVAGNVIKEDYFFGAKEAIINAEKCQQCGLCSETCRFGAISDELEIIPLKCEGCGACVLVCPHEAIRLEEVKTGRTYLTNTTQGTFSHALLDIGAEGSGRLVTEVKKNILESYKQEKWLLIDGSPGIGCVVIASITGSDAVVAVTEPTKSGVSDLERVLGVAHHFQIPSFVCINKYNLNLEITAQLEEYCQLHNCPVIGKIPFDESIVAALQAGKTPVEAGNNKVTQEIIQLWQRLTAALAEEEPLLTSIGEEG
ncbi:MAG TPA: ATP-binding protein [Oscillospiraceae bacterium]|nr:ATP-binding protein [Oscillospiraceae bacterium]